MWCNLLLLLPILTRAVHIIIFLKSSWQQFLKQLHTDGNKSLHILLKKISDLIVFYIIFVWWGLAQKTYLKGDNGRLNGNLSAGQARTKSNRLLDDRLKDDQIRNTVMVRVTLIPVI